ncbi:4-hydroxybenzoate octaprenyltransferase [Mesoterricola silvestris]|uniref:4-hydroxybenzoate polyprenyltransferase n=2 Tax=Mesoterricola silvestris TaxID=2927979 RepID=A0AA48KCN8_9BACT|nr:4-hydroxybenzoate octaprenyltransferase [Mesoterricola silvestris]
MIKFEHTVFALPFALLGGLATYRGTPPLEKVLLILLAMVGARTAAMTFNRLADEDLDAENPRTASRALPAGRVTRAGAYALLGTAIIVLCLAAGKLGPLPWKLVPVALVITLGYSFCKRFTAFAHVILGLSLAGAPLGAWIAVNGSVDEPVIYLALGVLTWTAGFDIIYALQDLDFDKDRGLHSVPSRLGPGTSLALSRLLHLAAMASWAVFNVRMEAHVLPWLGWCLVGGILLREQWVVRGARLDRIDHAFFTLNSLVGLIFFTGYAAEWFVGRAMP